MKTYMIVFCILLSAPAWAETWPNEPANSQALIDFPFSTKEGGGMQAVYPNGGTIVQDASAPSSAPFTLRYDWSHATHGNSSVTYYSMGDRSNFYAAFWWKPSAPFCGWQTNQNKIALFKSVSGGHTYILFTGSQGGPFNLSIQLDYGAVSNSHLGHGWGDATGPWNLFSNTGANTQVALGQWHLIELRAARGTSSTSKNGKFAMWLDGKMLHNYDTVNFPDNGFKEMIFTTVWDAAPTGCGSFPTDYEWYDHTHISTVGGTVEPPIEPPIVPTGPIVSGVTPDIHGADVTIAGKAKKLRYWDDFTPQKPELSDYPAGSLLYRLKKYWEVGTTFTCVEPQTEEGAWTGVNQCNRVNPGPPIVPPIEPPASVFTNVQAGATTLTFNFNRADCPNINIGTTGGLTRTATVTCVKDKQKSKKSKK